MPAGCLQRAPGPLVVTLQTWTQQRPPHAPDATQDPGRDAGRCCSRLPGGLGAAEGSPGPSSLAGGTAADLVGKRRPAEAIARSPPAPAPSATWRGHRRGGCLPALFWHEGALRATTVTRKVPCRPPRVLEPLTRGTEATLAPLAEPGLRRAPPAGCADAAGALGAGDPSALACGPRAAAEPGPPRGPGPPALTARQRCPTLPPRP